MTIPDMFIKTVNFWLNSSALSKWAMFIIFSTILFIL